MIHKFEKLKLKAKLSFPYGTIVTLIAYQISFLIVERKKKWQDYSEVLYCHPWRMRIFEVLDVCRHFIRFHVNIGLQIRDRSRWTQINIDDWLQHHAEIEQLSQQASTWQVIYIEEHVPLFTRWRDLSRSCVPSILHYSRLYIMWIGKVTWIYSYLKAGSL